MRIIWWKIHRPDLPNNDPTIEVTGDSMMINPQDPLWSAAQLEEDRRPRPDILRRIFDWAGEPSSSQKTEDKDPD